MSTERASTKVFDMYELREAILTKLPVGNALKAQRVCKAWQGVIQSSKAIRQSCYIEVEGGLLDPFVPKSLFGDGPVYDDQPTPSPLLRATQSEQFAVWPGNGGYWSDQCICTSMWLPAKKLASLPLTSTYREMHLTQPPCTAVLVDIGPRPFRWVSLARRGSVYHDKDGVKLGGLQDFAMELLDTNSSVGQHLIEIFEVRLRFMVLPLDEQQD